MRNFLILALIFVSLAVKAQHLRYDQHIDSITYKYYLNGDWNRLIDTTKQAIKNNIDFKHLRQRLGYTYFVKGDYYAAQSQYEKALAFDHTDITTRNYLYYCSLYSGNESNARYRGGLLTDELKTINKLKPFKIISAVDVEYNYKGNDNSKRGNPTYIRAGINTQLGYRLNLYQSFSTYRQKNVSTYQESGVLIPVQTRDSASIRQNEYFALLNWTITPHLSWNVGFHNLNSNVHAIYTYSYRLNSKQVKTVTDTTLNFPGNLFSTKFTYTFNRFDIGLSGSVFSYNSIVTQQYGVHVGIILPGKMNIYLKSSLYGMTDTQNNNRLIFTQKAGALLLKKLWTEGEITLGNLNNFSDNNGMYIYNSLDPTTFRSGLTLFWNILPKLTLFGNYTYDKKLIEEDKTNYNQHSFSGGIIWKL